MCNMASIALMGGGTILNTIGQQRALASQQAVLASQTAAEEAIRDSEIRTITHSGKRLMLDLASNRTNLAGIASELVRLGATGGGAANTIARAGLAQQGEIAQRDQNVRSRVGSRRSLDLAGNAMDRRMARTGLDERLALAGNKGAMLRHLGNAGIGLGQVFASSATPAGASGATESAKTILEDNGSADLIYDLNGSRRDRYGDQEVA